MRGLAMAGLLLVAPASLAQNLAARLQWASPLELSSPESGVVREVLVTAGDRVAPGAPLVRLDSRDRRAAVGAAEAGVAWSREALAEAARERQRTRELYDRTLLSDHDLQIAQIAWLNADAEYRRALAHLAERQLALEYAELSAPYPALVLRVLVATGQTVVNRIQATPMLLLARSDRMRATADLNPDQVAGLRAGQTLQVEIDGVTLDAVLVDPGLVPSDRDGARQYAIEVEFDWPGQRDWRAGQPAQILLP